ncbi:MAG: hypothetical protein H6624_05145 [Bdellovibrionaceae bacterium]|nr:hypothetical protein [Bdellovibrionales bacterium]MCB9083705.1 hypothetical protein [Pseudobdellovibrionaceae bacterium]
MTEQFKDYYETHLQRLARRLVRLEQKLHKANRQILVLLNWRLTVAALAIGVGLLVASGREYRNWGILFLGLVAFFVWLVAKSRRVRRWHKRLETWKAFQIRQMARLRGKTLELHLPEHPLDPLDSEQAILARDLYLVGDNSLFKLMNECFTSGGQNRLAQILINPLRGKQEILDRQQQIRELASRRWPLTRLFLLGQSGETQPDSRQLKLELEKPLISPGFKAYAILHLILYSLFVWIVASWLSGRTVFPPHLALGIYFLFSLASLGKAAKGFTQGESLGLYLESLLPVYEWLEKHQGITQKLAPTTLKLKPTRQMKWLRLCLSCLSIQAHPLVFLIVNGLFPWTYLWAGLLERWRQRHFDEFLQTLSEVEELEALGSLALFHCYQTPVFPQFTDSSEIQTRGLFHPLIVRSQVVSNDFSLQSPTRLGLITGSNMSGKSTFLRTLGINQHLAMVGASVFADEMTTFVGPVVTCLQIRDSLEDGYSSFYYEVKRVKQVIEQATEGQSFLYLIDEIFRGTNNRERLLGSQAVIRKLLESPRALGMITTHDLELTQLESEFPQLANGHFRDEVKEGSSGLHFSYLYHPGPCPTTNALKIMAAEGLPIT